MTEAGLFASKFLELKKPPWIQYPRGLFRLYKIIPLQTFRLRCRRQC